MEHTAHFADTQALCDTLTGALIALARATDGEQPGQAIYEVMLLGLASTLPTGKAKDAMEAMIREVRLAKNSLKPDCALCACPCGRTSEYDMKELDRAEDTVRSAKLLLLFGLQSLAVYACNAMALGRMDDRINQFFCRGLFAIGEDWEAEEVLSVAREIGQIQTLCLEMLMPVSIQG